MLRDCFDRILDNLRTACIQKYGDRLITLGVFGSVGRGTPNPYSDIDLLLIVEGLSRGRLSRVQEFSAVEEVIEPVLRKEEQHGCHTRLSPVIKTPDEVAQGSLLFLDMIDDIRLLVDMDRFFQKFLENFGRHLCERHARRIPSKGAWYWDLKPGYSIGEQEGP